MSKLREPDIIFKWSNCCRLCLSQESTIDLFSEASIVQHFPSKIRTCLNFLIYSGDPMPRKICAACCMKLDSWCQFRKECIQTEKDLRRRLGPYKRISFVREYFDKYMKYEKSSKDGSVSLESMSEYDEEEMEDEDVDDEDDIEIYSDFMQREDENSGLSESDKVVSLSDLTGFNDRQKCQNPTPKILSGQFASATCNIGNDMETNNGVSRGTSCYQRRTKNKVNEIGGITSDKTKTFCNEKDDNNMQHSVASSTENSSLADAHEKAENEASENGELVNESNGINCTEGSIKTCPDCGIDFPSEDHLALHNCIINDSGPESDDNDNLINPLSFVDTSLSEPNAKDSTGKGCLAGNVTDSLYKVDGNSEEKTCPANRWKCIVCNDHFKSAADLKEHYNSPNGECGKTDVDVECECCRIKFPTKDELVEHQIVHFNTGSSTCSRDQLIEGDDRPKRITSCNDSETPTDGEIGYFCSKCDRSFFDKELFEKHELIHNQQDLYNSIETPQFTAFEGLEGLDDLDDSEHADGDKKQNIVRCFRCGRIFGSAEELEQHEFLKHKNPTPFFCRKCDLRFSARSQLLMHVRSHMRKSTSGAAATPGVGASDNTCAICGAKFFLPSDLQSHLKMHKYSPTEESTTPPTQKSWQIHDPYEDNKIDLFARFKCSVCSKIFVHSGSIVRHGKNLHKGQAVYPLRLKRPIFLMKRARSLTVQTEKSQRQPNQLTKLISSSSPGGIGNPQQDEPLDGEMNQETKWDQDCEGLKSDPGQEFGTEKCPFCEKVFKPTYLPRHIKRNHRGEVLDPQMLGREIPDDSLVCRYCLKSCSNPHNRRVHESIHYPVKMQCTQCKICGQKFFSKSSYEVHVAGCKSVRCGQCNKIFFRYLSLKNHSCIVTIPAENKA